MQLPIPDIQEVNKLNISLALPADVKRRAIDVSQWFNTKCRAEFVLGELTNLPHITLCSMAFPVTVMCRIFEMLETIGQKFSPIVCQPTLVETHQRYIGVQIEKTPEIIQLHTEVLTALAPLRAIEEGAGKHYLMDLKPQQLRYIEEYGYPDAL